MAPKPKKRIVPTKIVEEGSQGPFAASQDADMTAEQAALAEVVSPPAAQAESAARRALGPYRRLEVSLSLQGGTTVSWKELIAAKEAPAPAAGAPPNAERPAPAAGAQPQRAYGLLAEVIEQIERRETRFGMVPESDADEGTTSKDGEEEGEGDAEGEDDSDSGEDEEGRQGGTPGEGRQGDDGAGPSTAGEGTGAKGKGAKKRARPLSVGNYDYNDDFLDDEELAHRAELRVRQKQRRGKYDGFFMHQGELEVLGEDGATVADAARDEWEGGEEPVKPPLDPEYFPHLLIHERDAMAAIRASALKMAAGEASAGVVWAAVGAIGVIHEDDMATGEWGFLKGLLQELAPVAGPLGGERAVRERLAAAATRWRARLSQAMDAAAAAIQKDFEEARKEGRLPLPGHVDKDGRQLSLKLSKETEVLLVDIAEIWKEKLGSKPRMKKVWPALLDKCPREAMLTEAFLAQAYTRVTNRLRLKKKERANEGPGGATPRGQGALASLTAGPGPSPRQSLADEDLVPRARGRPSDASGFGREAPAPASTQAEAGTAGMAGPDEDLLRRDRAVVFGADEAEAQRLAKQKRTRHRQSAFTYLLSRGAEGGKLADIAAAIVANSGAEDEAKERKRVSTYLGNQLREDEVFVPMGGGMYALRAFFSEQDRARYMERAEVEKQKRRQKVFYSQGNSTMGAGPLGE